MTETPHSSTETHPSQLLLQKHKIIIPSRLTKPYGRSYIKKKLRPPKQLMNKWFFMKDFSNTSLVFLKCTSANLNYVTYGKDSENNLTNINSLNYATFYTNGNFAQGDIATQMYKPIKSLPYSTDWVTIKATDKSQETKITMDNNYRSSVSYNTGWFNSQILQAYKVVKPNIDYPTYYQCRYNPNRDTGKGNKAWLKSIFSEGWGPPTTHLFLIVKDEPL